MIRDVTKSEGLDLRAANGGVIRVEVEFQLIYDVRTSVLLTVPILVARDELVYPIIHGYNVIEEMTRNKGQGRRKEAIFDAMSFALVDVNVESISALVEFVQGQVEESLCF